MRNYLAIITFIVLLFMFGCSEETINDPNENLEAYIDQWNHEHYSDMYRLLSAETTDQYEAEYFIEHPKELYSQIGMEDFNVTYTKLTDEEIEQAIENKEVSIQADISMESIAGSINFSEKIKLSLIEVDDETEEWKIHWHPGLILPDYTDQSTLSINNVTPKRGEILDRNRIPLAINDIAFEVGLVPEKFVNEAEEINEVAQALKMDKENVKSHLEADWVEPHHYVPIKKIGNDNNELINRLNGIPSVQLNETEARSYPLGEKAAHLTGYIGNITAEELDELDDKELYSETDIIGKNGLEKIFESRLRGEDGVTISIEDSEGNHHVIAEKSVKNGEVITLTIDINIQEKAFDSFDDYSGTAVVINPKTGEILSLASFPAFNPNDLIFGISQSKWETLLNDDMQPLYNRFSATFAPGSALKPITGAIGLNNGTITHDETIDIKGLTWSKEDWDDFEITRVSESDKPVDLQDAIVRSDNIYFAMKSIEMGGENYLKGLKQFGFNESIPFDYPIKKSQISNNDSLNNERLLANTSYGQGELQASPLHMALLYTAFINEGNVIKPILELENSNEEYWLENTLSSEDANKISSYLRDVVTDGTGQIANLKDLEISGKTSTVELKSSKEEDGHLNSWFIGYPTKEEDIIVAMMLEKTDDKGSSIAVESVANLIYDITNENY